MPSSLVTVVHMSKLYIGLRTAVPVYTDPTPLPPVRGRSGVHVLKKQIAHLARTCAAVDVYKLTL